MCTNAVVAAFDYDKVLLDVDDWLQWMAREEGDPQRSYRAWWADEYSFYTNLDLLQRGLCIISRHGLA